MSKPCSGLFNGTTGHKKYLHKIQDIKDIISERTVGLDLREHPRKKSLTSNQRKEINQKIKNRTATKSEYKQKESDRRFAQRRKNGVNSFWMQEKRRIRNGLPTTREWNEEQKAAILQGSKPKYKGKTIQGHHTFSASKYPHLANVGEIIYPVTFDEHLYGWHGGNFKNSKPGKPIYYANKHKFRE